MLETGEFATAKDLATREKINPSYLGRVLRLTLLAPDLAQRILDGTQPSGLQLDQLFRSIPEDWTEQRKTFGAHNLMDSSGFCRGELEKPREHA
jgi:hypothetical protein